MNTSFQKHQQTISSQHSLKNIEKLGQGKEQKINENTAIKGSKMPIFSQMTPKPVKKVILMGEQQKKYLFPLVRDRDVGIETKYQNIVIESHNDDDRRTTSTQLERGMIQTLKDLYQIMNEQCPSESDYYSQY